VPRQTAGTVGYRDVIRLKHAIPMAHRKNGAFAMDDTVEQSLEEAVDGNGRPLFREGFVGGPQMGMEERLAGRPYMASTHLPDLGLQGDVVYGDWKGYYIADRSPIAIARSEHVRFLKDQTVFRVVKRVGGLPAIPQLFGILDDSTS